MRILIIYSWPTLWSMGTGKGSPDFYLSLKALAGAFSRVVLVHPGGPDCLLAGQLPEGIESLSFRWPGGGKVIGRPAWLRDNTKYWGRLSRILLFALNWSLRLFSYLAFTLNAWRAAGKAASGGDFDLVAAYGYMGVPAGRLISRKLGLPLVVRLFGVSLGMKGFSFPARLAQFEETLSFRIAAGRWVITNDGSGGDQVARRLGVPEDKVLYLLNGVDKSRGPRHIEFDREQYRQRLGLASETRVVLRVARLWPQQRIDRLIEALAACPAAGLPVAAVVIGEGSEREYLETLALELGVRVIFTGAVANRDLAEHYLCADLYLATSDRTNLSNSALEALNHGLPVIALDTGGTGSVIREGVNGRLVAFEQRQRLGAILKQTLSDSALLARLAGGALRTAEEFIPSYEQRMEQEVAAMSFRPVDITHLSREKD